MDRIHRVQHVAIAFADGTVGVMQFVLDPRVPLGEDGQPVTKLVGYDHETGEREASDEAIQAEIAKSAFLSAPVSWVRVAAEDVPTDRTYREAWTHNGKAFGHDMVKARAMQRDRIRADRVALMAKLDSDYLKADEIGDAAKKAQIAAKKQKLRDAPAAPAIDAAASVEQLKALTLSSITGVA